MKDGREVLLTSDTSGESWSVAMWDPLTGSMLSQFRNASPIASNSLQLLKDSYLLGADATKPRIHIWPVNSQVPVANLRLTTPGKVSALSCTSCGTYISAAVDEKVFIWQTSTGKLLKTLARHYQAVTCLKFSSDGSHLATAGQDGLVFIYSVARVINDYQEARPLHGFSDHTLGVKGIYFGAFGARCRIVTVSLDRTARIYDANSGVQLLTLIFDVPLTSVCLDKRECSMFVGCINGHIRQFDLRNPPRGREHHVPGDKEEKGIFFKGHTSSVNNLSVSIDCITLLSGSADGNVNIWNIPSCQVIRSIQHKGGITNALFVPHYANFNVNVLKPKLLVKPLQRIVNEDNGILEIVKCGEDDLLNPQDFFQESGEYSGNIELEKKLSESRAEIERLKKINSEMFKYGVKCLLHKK
ncbi:WD repeat-containing protein 18 [Fopius arisanus]|uniref:WD repeat-containing protein 18 n=1 Tax=Fopius arisanus TaxID=64838 RepID=A0A0C9QZS8_9HYME|nr:PREDICTED: WD repeat-containing protein 18 [Fopius arisanus]